MNRSLTLKSKASHSKTTQAGLTLIELMTVLAIISILGVIGTPLYQGYSLKTKVGTAIPLMAPVQRLATEHFIFNNSWPADNNEAGARAPDTYDDNYLSSISITDSPEPGSIVLTYDTSQLKVLGTNNTLVFYPVLNGTSSVSWKCDKGTIADRYRPATCRS